MIPVPPKGVKAWRESQFSVQAKSDTGDARVICDYFRLRFDELSVLKPFSEQTRALRATVCSRDDIVAQRVAVSNQLRATLHAFWPGAASLFSSLFSQSVSRSWRPIQRQQARHVLARSGWRVSFAASVIRGANIQPSSS